MATTMNDSTFGNPAVSARTGSGARRAHAAPGIEYRALYAVVFAVCFVLAAILRLAPRRLHPWIEAGARRRSLAAEARAAADATVPYVFQVS